MALNPKDLKERADKAFTRTRNWYGLWKDAYRLCLPQRDMINISSPGASKNNTVFDSSGQVGLKAFANRLQQALFPPFRDFVSLRPGPAVPLSDHDRVNQILQDASDKFHAAIHRSNFSTAINEGFLELGIGTMAMIFDQGTYSEPFMFAAVPVPMLGIENGPRDQVGGIFRKDKRRPETIEMTWRGSSIPDRLRSEKKDEEVDLIEATYLDYDKGTWCYDVILPELSVSIFDKPREYGARSPWIVTRWMKVANEAFGRGPVLDALPDIRTANKVVEFVLKNASIAIAGVWTGVDDGVLNPDTVVIAPGRVIPVAHNAGSARGPSLSPLQTGASFDVSQLVLGDLRESIKRTLFDSQLPPEAGPVRSPTEFLARLRQMQMDIGAPFGRLMRELVHPLVHRGLEILADFQMIEFPFEIDGTTVEAMVVSPIAQEQGLDKVETAVNWITLMMQMGGMEMAAINADMEKLGPWAAREMGVDAELVRDGDSRMQLMAMAAQMVAAAAQQQQQQQPPAGEGEGTPPAAPPANDMGDEDMDMDIGDGMPDFGEEIAAAG